ncbi:hypothetical protein [Teredinibacter franksiae]|uniref:hypothetical protein n=1 Tax=Teredinibacter franksiae TaxID=2761453 RepID=UPI00162A65CC|nr:hypothetical protein [Teredinibacter franksiae]
MTNISIYFSKLALVFALGLISASVFSQGDYSSPLIKQWADPMIYRHTDGWFYFIATAPEFGRIELRRLKTITGLAETKPTVIWRKHDSVPQVANIRPRKFTILKAYGSSITPPGTVRSRGLFACSRCPMAIPT